MTLTWSAPCFKLCAKKLKWHYSSVRFAFTTFFCALWGPQPFVFGMVHSGSLDWIGYFLSRTCSLTCTWLRKEEMLQGEWYISFSFILRKYEIRRVCPKRTLVGMVHCWQNYAHPLNAFITHWESTSSTFFGHQVKCDLSVKVMSLELIK